MLYILDDCDVTPTQSNNLRSPSKHYMLIKLNRSAITFSVIVISWLYWLVFYLRQRNFGETWADPENSFGVERS